jgi:hypothetical protein
MVPQPKTITIFNATGIQGSSVLHYLLKATSPTAHNIRAITTSPPTTASAHLPPLSKHPNLTIHQLPPSDYFNPTSLKSALEGTNILFLTTNSNAPNFVSKHGGKGEKSESDFIKLVLDVVVADIASIELVVMSTLPGLGEVGAWNTDFREKGAGMEYAKGLVEKGTGLRIVYLELGWYYSNFLIFHPLEVSKVDGVVEVGMAGADENVKGPWVSSYTDLGPIVYAIIKNPEQYLNTEILIAGEWLSVKDVARIYSEVTGQKTRIIHTTPIARVTDFPSITGTAEEKEWAYLSGIYNEGYYGRDVSTDNVAEELIKSVEGRGLKSFKQWLVDAKINAMEEGFGEVVRKSKEEYGGRIFV